MWPRLQTATARTDGGWTAEMAFPLRGGAGAGGLLDGGEGWGRFHPGSGAKYWLLDFARAEHPFFVGDAALFAPLCGEVLRESPTLLGTTQWTCYFEYVWQALGATRYMHNPDMFGFLQFAPPPASGGATAACRALEWPVRYVLSQVWRAQTAYAAASGRYAANVSAIAEDYCTVANSCNVEDLLAAMTTYSDVFHVEVEVDNAAASCVNYRPKNYTGGPCFTARATAGLDGFRVTGTIREDRFLDVPQVGDAGAAACLVPA